MSAANSCTRLTRRLLMLCFAGAATLLLLHDLYYVAPAPAPPPRRALIVPSLLADDTTWITRTLPAWEHYIYTVDSPTSALTTPANKGREAMVYLTFIIDHYESLPDTMVFMHASRYQWHNDHPTYDGLPLLANLNLAHLPKRGYINLRCTHTLGCPVEMQIPPAADTPDISVLDNVTTLRGLHTERFYAAAFAELFPGRPIPAQVGASCCAQFAVTKEKVRAHELGEWMRWRQWLLDTPLPDRVAGRIWEYSWHILFGMEEVHCPDMETCYCELWGLCGLQCGERGCGRYVMPESSLLPEGWPERGWGGERGPGEMGLV